jgi:hypothetical protein
MNWSGFFKACLACFQGSKPVKNHYAMVWTGVCFVTASSRVVALKLERNDLIKERARLRKNKKRHTHLDPRLQEITTELLKLERDG